MPAANHKVEVPQKDGEITITDATGPTTYPVKDGVVTVKADELDRFLAHVDGATEKKD
jgi:hypothetical protein